MLPKKNRLREFEVKKVFSSREGSFFSDLCVIRKRKNTSNRLRFALVISRKHTKKSVVRNIYRRTFYWALDRARFLPLMNTGYDYVFLLKKNISLIQDVRMQKKMEYDISQVLKIIIS